jgi:CelD/BcsL family acetyltransferase involved in cellulose biosynthesis
MPIDCVDPTENLAWQKFVEQTVSTVFHSPEWLRVLKQTYGFNIHAHLLRNENGETRAGLPFCTIEDMMDPRIVSLPFTDFCDPLVENVDDWRCLIDGILNSGHRMSLRCLHNDLPLGDGRFTLTNRAKWHIIDLQADEATLWQRLRGSARRAIKKAQQNDIVVQAAQSKEGLRAFFELHLRVRKYKYGLLAQPYRFFENIWDQFIAQGKGTLMLASCQEEVIGGVMFLEWQNTLYYKFNASNPAMTVLRPNDLIVWEGMRYGQFRGLHYLDFGLSDWDQEGLLQYKRKFATAEKTISLLAYAPEGSPSAKEKQIRQLLPKLTDLFVAETVPDSITEKAGEALYQFFT